jgi:hypothetical protein
VRMHGRLRATLWGFSIWEFWVSPTGEVPAGQPT